MTPATSPFTSADGAYLHIEEWGDGPPVVFTHGWALGAEMWEYPMSALADSGLRCVGVDRRGCGRSTAGRLRPSFDLLADDLAALLEHLDLRGATLVAHSMAAGEALRLLARHGDERIDRLVLVAPTTPRVLQAPDHPGGVPRAVFDEVVAGLRADKPAYLAAAAPGFFGGEADVSPELARWGVGLAARASVRTSVDLVRTFTEEDSRADLAAVRIPTLVVCGGADASAPLELCARPTADGIAGSRLEVYAGGPHGLPLAAGYKERLTEDIAAWTGVAVGAAA